MYTKSLCLAATFLALATGTPLPSMSNQTGQKPGCTKFKKLNLKAIVPVLQKKLVRKAVKKQIADLDCANATALPALEKQAEKLAKANGKEFNTKALA
jgi:hypothetical protein